MGMQRCIEGHRMCMSIYIYIYIDIQGWGGVYGRKEIYMDILDLETRALGFRVAGLYGRREPAHHSASGVQPTGAYGGRGGLNIGTILRV